MAGAAGLASAASAFNPWTAAAAAVPSLFKGISGAIQVNKANRIAQKNVRQIYSRPTEVGQGLALAEQNYFNGVMPGTSVARNNISSAGSNAMDNITQAASSGADVLDGITKVQYNEGLQTNDLATQQAAYKNQQLAEYQNQLKNSAQYADKEFAYNKDQPYQANAAAASAMMGAGNQNVGAAVNELGSLATTIGLNGGFNGDGTPPQINNGNTLGELPTSAQDLLVKRNTNVLGALPSSAARVNVNTTSRFNPAMGRTLVWDPYSNKATWQ